MSKHEISAYATALAELLTEDDQTLGPTDRGLCAHALRLLAATIAASELPPIELELS